MVYTVNSELTTCSLADYEKQQGVGNENDL